MSAQESKDVALRLARHTRQLEDAKTDLITDLQATMALLDKKDDRIAELEQQLAEAKKPAEPASTS